MGPVEAARRSSLGVRRGTLWLVRGFLRDLLVNGTLALSLIVVITGFFTQESSWGIAGVVVGSLGLTLPWMAMSMQWPMPRLRRLVQLVVVADLTLLTAMLLAA